MRIGNEPQIDARSPLAPWRRVAAWLAVSLVLGLAGCRKDMYDQPKYKAYEPSGTFADGTSSRQLLAGTVARGPDQLRADTLYYEGNIDGKDSEVFPFPIDEATIEMGRERYTVFCSPCHGQQGNAKGMVVRRGFSPPPDLHAEYLRKIPVGHFFNVITHGYGAMYSYEARIPVKQRWAIAAYIRALQYSQDATPADLEESRKLAEAEKAAHPTHDESKSEGEVKK
jgi:mono/diheme cytochrome c family protein